MLTEDELARVLRRELHDLASEARPSPELLERLDAIPGPSRARRRSRAVRAGRRPRPWLLAPAGALLTAVVVVCVFVFAGSDPPRAQAITIFADGRMIHVSLRDIEAVTPANARLRLLEGVRVVAMTPGCRTPTRDISYMGISALSQPKLSFGSPHDSGSTVFIAARRLSRTLVSLAIGRVRGPAPACVSSHGVGPGLPGYHFPAGTSTSP